mmetsp:Transcript_20729/g.64414  ORF Transcript_20729/g.64414 Transcript_20729/m.64414 type:complete len:349 (+) Transcript_20729:320-1366(+)
MHRAQPARDGGRRVGRARVPPEVRRGDVRRDSGLSVRVAALRARDCAARRRCAPPRRTRGQRRLQPVGHAHAARALARVASSKAADARARPAPRGARCIGRARRGRALVPPPRGVRALRALGRALVVKVHAQPRPLERRDGSAPHVLAAGRALAHPLPRRELVLGPCRRGRGARGAVRHAHDGPQVLQGRDDEPDRRHRPLRPAPRAERDTARAGRLADRHVREQQHWPAQNREPLRPARDHAARLRAAARQDDHLPRGRRSLDCVRRGGEVHERGGQADGAVGQGDGSGRRDRRRRVEPRRPRGRRGVSARHSARGTDPETPAATFPFSQTQSPRPIRATPSARPMF